jgi:Planctomycete cytochrome C/Anaphase-promoting complex subunit 4 WD40 domain
MRAATHIAATAALIALMVLPVRAQTAKRINYEDDVKVVFQRHCLMCHSASQMTAGLSLESFAGIMKGGGSGQIVIPGRAVQSLLYQVVSQETDGVPRMPLGLPKISDDEIALIRDWIQQGLLADATSQPRGQTAASVDFKPGTPSSPWGQPAMPENLPAVAPAVTIRPQPVTALAASPWAPVLAVAGHERIDLYNWQTRAPIGALAFPEGIPYVLRFSRDGASLLAGGGRSVQYGTVVVYDVRTGKRKAVFGQEKDIVLAADLNADGTLVALGGPSKLVKVYSTNDGRLLYQINKHTDWITSLSFSPDGAYLATGDRAGGIFLWDSGTGAIIVSLAEHKDSVTALAWRGDSRVLASGGRTVNWCCGTRGTDSQLPPTRRLTFPR